MLAEKAEEFDNSDSYIKGAIKAHIDDNHGTIDTDSQDEGEIEEKPENNSEEDDYEDEVLIEIEVSGKKYYADESKVGNIYEFLEDGEIGEEIGHYVNGEPIIF